MAAAGKQRSRISQYRAQRQTAADVATVSADRIYFTRHYQGVAYQMAAAVPTVIYQQPCFCWCSRALGHKSLYSCFQDTHGATCSVCMSEAAFAYQQTRQGRTPAEIRSAIIRGDWKTVSLPGLSLD